ncbi:MAG: HEAT repeat domain-containing protein, partial [Chlamydiales bacterium]
MGIRIWILALLWSAWAWSDIPQSSQEGRILFLIQQGEHQQALKLYQKIFQAKEDHHFELLHRIGIGLLDYGFRQQDPEIQLLTLFGAMVSAHEDAYYILEESLKSRYPQIQLVALGGLSQIQQDRADKAIVRALGASHLLVRYEAVSQLCKKKHPQAVDQAESLMYKSPRAILPLYPPLFARLGNAKSIRILRKLMNDPSENVRISVILSVAKYERDDFLPQIRQQVMHFNFAQQEASAYALGTLKDEQSLTKLNKLTSSQYPTVALAANWALYHLGQESAAQAIEDAALREDVFAIAALGTLSEHSPVLLKLMEHPHLQVRMNAILALLEQQDPAALDKIEEVLIRGRLDLAFLPIKSPGKAFTAWKVVSGASQMLKEDIEAYKEHLELKESLLAKVKTLSSQAFLKLAAQIFAAQQNDLVPALVDLLEEMNTPEALGCLKIHQQKLGAPLIRNYCNLSLYRLGETGPYGDLLRQWVRNQSQTDLIRFRAFDPWEINQNTHQFTPEESSRLLIESFEAFANNQDMEGIELLIDVIADG